MASVSQPDHLILIGIARRHRLAMVGGCVCVCVCARVRVLNCRLWLQPYHSIGVDERDYTPPQTRIGCVYVCMRMCVL
jgi:hypothetical protein